MTPWTPSIAGGTRRPARCAAGGWRWGERARRTSAPAARACARAAARSPALRAERLLSRGPRAGSGAAREAAAIAGQSPPRAEGCNTRARAGRVTDFDALTFWQPVTRFRVWFSDR